MPVLGKFGPKNQNCQFKQILEYAKFNSAVHIFFIWQEYPFLANLVQKSNIVSLSSKFILKLIQIWAIQ